MKNITYHFLTHACLVLTRIWMKSAAHPPNAETKATGSLSHCAATVTCTPPHAWHTRQSLRCAVGSRLLAFEQSSLDHVHSVSCEIEPSVMRTLLHNFEPHRPHRDVGQLPQSSFQWCGFHVKILSAQRPAQKHRQRSRILGDELCHKKSSPRVCVLENVSGFGSHFKDFSKALIDVFKGIGNDGLPCTVE